MHPPSNSAVRTTRDKNKSRTKRAKRAKVTVSICIHRVTNREIIDIERREDRDRDRGEVVYISNNKQKVEKSATHPASRTSHAYTYDIYIYICITYTYIYINYIICIFLYVIFIYAQTVAFVEYISEVSNIQEFKIKILIIFESRCSTFFTFQISEFINLKSHRQTCTFRSLGERMFHERYVLLYSTSCYQVR